MNKFIMLISMLLPFSALSELEFTQLSFEIGNDDYSSMKTYDMDADGDVDIYNITGNTIRWFENHDGDFILHKIEIDADNSLRFTEVATETVDFWNLDWSDDSSNVTINTFNEVNHYAKSEVLTLSRSDDNNFKIFVGDFNGDSRVDFLNVDLRTVDINGLYEVTLHYYYNLGNGQFVNKTAIDKFLTPVSLFGRYTLEILDVNNDGRDDVVYFNHYDQDTGVMVYHKSTDNNTYELVSMIDDLNYSNIRSIRYLARDADGLLDLFIFGSTTTWYEQVNDTFVADDIVFDQFIASNRPVFFEDYDADNDFDMVVLPSYSNRGSVFVYENINGEFVNEVEVGYIDSQHSGLQTLSKPGQSNMSFAALSWNSVFSDRINSYQYRDNVLQTKQVSNDFLNFSGVDVEDIDGNGMNDLLIFDQYSKEVMVMFQTLNYEFSTQVFLTLDHFPQDIIFHDEDNDGDLDLIMVVSDEVNSYFQVFHKEGTNNYVLNESDLLPEHLFGAIRKNRSD